MAVHGKSVRKAGQTAAEYVIVFALLLGAAWAAMILLRAVRTENALVHEAVAGEYP
ncbi:MAG: hypothetical protein IJ802_00930 [Kiritimatiellae bacterium]|nr:hypothetical protein [Kiritimatiellia bacterium]